MSYLKDYFQNMTKSREQYIIELGQKVFDTNFINPSVLNITSRRINYWIDKKLMPFTERQENSTKKTQYDRKSERKWVRLSLAQSVWAYIIDELLSYKISLEKLEKLTENIWQKPRVERYADKVLKNHIDKNPVGLSEKSLQELISFLQDEMHMENYIRTIINPFTDAIKSAFTKRELPHSLLYAPESNSHAIHSGDQALILDLGSKFMQSTMICIPLVPIMARVMASEFNDERKTDLYYLNNIERQIRDIVVFKKPKEVVIAFENDSIKPITVTEQHKTREKLARYILENKIKKGSKLLIDIRSRGNYKITLILKSDNHFFGFFKHNYITYLSFNVIKIIKVRIPVSIFMKNGIKLQGTIESFDQFVVMLKNVSTQVVFKHAISTVVPSRNVRLPSEAEEASS